MCLVTPLLLHIKRHILPRLVTHFSYLIDKGDMLFVKSNVLVGEFFYACVHRYNQVQCLCCILQWTSFHKSFCLLYLLSFLQNFCCLANNLFFFFFFFFCPMLCWLLIIWTFVWALPMYSCLYTTKPCERDLVVIYLMLFTRKTNIIFSFCLVGIHTLAS